MSHEGGPEQPQRTVAELLAKYGAESGERPRRRRRRADDVSDTGAQQIIDRVLSESGEMQAIRDDMPPPERTSHRRGAPRPAGNIDASTEFAPQVDPRRQPPPPSTGQQSSQRLPRPLPPQPSQRLPRPAPGQQSSSQLPGIAQGGGPTTPVRGTPRPTPGQQSSQQLPRPQPSQRVPLPPPTSPSRSTGTRDRTGIRSRLDADPPPASPSLPVPPPPPPVAGPSAETTEELPRVPGRIPVDGSMTGRRPAADAPTQYAPAYPYPEEDEGYNAYPEADPDERYDADERYDSSERYDTGERYDSAEYDGLLDEDDRRDRRDPDGALDELDDLDDEDLDEDRQRSPAVEWLVMLGQLALGVIGGAGVWLGFNWLWGFLPAAALAAAVVVIAVLVLIVRKIRRAEDLQTTVLAVLVGLVVTVSPAALLLLDR